MPHSARRVLCTPVLRSLRSRSWLKAQMTDVRRAEICSCTCLMPRDSGAQVMLEFILSTGISSFYPLLPMIHPGGDGLIDVQAAVVQIWCELDCVRERDRKSTRLNSSHSSIS